MSIRPYLFVTLFALAMGMLLGGVITASSPSRTSAIGLSSHTPCLVSHGGCS